jgi:hypothetical protein
MLTLNRDYAVQARTASGTNIVLGVWLIASPWIFDYSGRSAVVISVFVGSLIALFAAFRLASLFDSMGLSGVNLILALGIIASPWACGYAANLGGTRNSVIVGTAIVALALWSGVATMAEEKRLRDEATH